jgi:hypothetical protein
MSSVTAADIAQRAKFYSEPDVVRMISKHGVPKSHKDWETIVMDDRVAKLVSGTTQSQIDCMSFVSFTVHPQQINVRDKANGKVIAVISR